MIATPKIVSVSQEKSAPTFWEHILNLQELRGHEPLEKLLAGCEIIAALDGVDLLAA
jgi:hypothetical protein